MKALQGIRMMVALVGLAVVAAGCSAGLAARAGSAQFQIGDVPLAAVGQVDPLAGTGAGQVIDDEAKVPLFGLSGFVNRGAVGAFVIRNVSRLIPELVKTLFGADASPPVPAET